MTSWALEFAPRLAGALALILNLLGFVVIDERRTKLLLAASSAGWAVQYGFNGVHTGMGIMVLAAIRQALSAYTFHWPFKCRLRLSWFFTALACIVTALTWQGWVSSSLPLVATLIGTWSFFVLSNVGMRKATLVSNLMWGLHGFLFNSWELCITMLVLTGATVVGLWRLRRE
ncbi:YgjV family protein [Limnobacter humi]|uniref:YgjV family protein n=1 Tax=Limnobacter humi TaxID=1778671 RepID=A0ABT1WDG0_9BURK|nr:YgjV family protein [Limnobacter humi]MCQ8895557.1 YgjV family protein [Limnobacter humi]